ncbi:hypothetical protein HHK36_000307 [Tetracentron sinense]|uniref:BHLH domain-containing protein n=1 Tax=Tetracentron sinense TaxID=13715 RepID=A0A834ZVN7_TETSI|nr:hypothetical protein HHK36_000307 [Tetracentron sinense]
MSPLHQSDELFQISSNPGHEQIIQQDMLLVTPSLDSHDLTNKVDKKGRCVSWTTSGHNDECDDEIEKKKVIRREIERQRRQEMATLCASLQCLLPLKYFKGKRSTSDQLYEAVNYITDLQKKILELSDKRDRLQRWSNLRSNGSSNSCLCVTVRSCLAGVEVVISSGKGEKALPFSRVLDVLIEEGLSVLSCSFTKVNGRSLHTIQSEVSDLTMIDLSGLQQKLMDLI